MYISFLSMFKKRFMLPLLVLMLLSGCGQLSSAQTPQNTPVSMHSGSITPSSGPAPVGTSVAFDLGGWIHVQSAGGFICSVRSGLTPGTLVLPTVQSTYDQGTLLSVENYVTAAYNQVTRASRPDTAPYPAFSANPDAFQLVAVNVASQGCWEVLQITNIGNAPVQISQISMQFTADTRINNQHYNLIDACSLNSSVCSPGGGGVGVYQAQFDLHSEKANTIMPATCWGYGSYSCSPQALSLKAGEIATVYLEYFSHSSNSLSFSLMPSFTLDWPGKQTTYPVPQLQETFAFASDSQFSCYALQGQQFINVPVDATHWCT